MSEEEVGKVKGSKTKLIAGIVVVVILVAGVGAVWLLYGRGTGQGITPPVIRMNVYETNESYLINITGFIYLRTDLNMWTDVNTLYFIVSNDTINYNEKVLKTYLDEKPKDKILAAGRIVDILNDTNSNVTYLDRDGDYTVSVNDTVIINKSLLTGYEIRAYFFFIYEGDEGGHYSRSRLVVVDGEAFVWHTEGR